MRKDKPETFNCYVPQRYLDMVNEQLKTYPALKPSDVIGNILDIYYQKDVEWSKNKLEIEKIREQREQEELDKLNNNKSSNRKLRQSFK